MYDGTLLVVGLSLELFENEKSTYSQLLLNLPAETELCGVIKFGDTLTMETNIKEILQVRFHVISVTCFLRISLFGVAVLASRYESVLFESSEMIENCL